MNARDHSLFVLQLRRFRRDQAQNYFLIFGYMLQAFKSAGACIVKLQIQGADLFLSKYQLRDLVVSTGAGPGGMEVPTADVGVDNQILRLSLNYQIVDLQEFFLQFFRSCVVGSKEHSCLRIHKTSPGGCFCILPRRDLR